VFTISSRRAVRRSTLALASRTRSNRRGESLRRISSPPETPWVVDNNRPAKTHTTGTPNRQSDRRRLEVPAAGTAALGSGFTYRPFSIVFKG
jgi:hypothetical protein